MWWWLYVCGGSGCTWKFHTIVYFVLYADLHCPMYLHEDMTSVPCATWSLRKSHRRHFSAFEGTPVYAMPLVIMGSYTHMHTRTHHTHARTH